MVSDPAWDAEDVAQQAAEIRLRRGGAGRSSRRQIEADARRELGARWRRHPDPTLHGAEPVDVADAPRGAFHVEQSAGLVGEIRDRFEASGCLWTRDFEEWLTERLGPRGTRRAARQRQARKASWAAADAAVVAWVRSHEGQAAGQRVIAEALGLRRGAVRGAVERLIDAGKIRGQPNEHRYQPTRWFMGDGTCED